MDSPPKEERNIEMEPNVSSSMANKLWRMVRVVCFMLRKGISKGKLMMDLKLMMTKRNNKLNGKSIHNLKLMMTKRNNKLNGKSIHNLLFHNNKVHNHFSSAFSAITSATHRRTHDKKQELFQNCPPPGEYEFSCSNTPEPTFQLPFNLNKRKSRNIQEDEFAVHAVMKTLEMLNSGAASPALPGFGKSPMVRQLRITDSPFPLKDVDEDSHVDEAAQEFIEKFYQNLRRQNSIVS